VSPDDTTRIVARRDPLRTSFDTGARRRRSPDHEHRRRRHGDPFRRRCIGGDGTVGPVTRALHDGYWGHDDPRFATSVDYTDA